MLREITGNDLKKKKKNHYLPSHTLYFLIKSWLFKQEEEV